MGVYSTGKALKIGADLMEVVRENPLLATIVGVGVGWLIATETNGARKAEILKKKELEAKGFRGASRKFLDLASSACEQAQQIREQAAERAKEFGCSAQKHFQKAGEGIKQMAEEKPVTVAAASLALAAALGFGIWGIVRERD